MTCAPAFDYKIGNAANSVVSEVMVFTKSYNGERNGRPEGYSARQCAFEDLQRCADSRWLTDGLDHNTAYNFSMWPDNVLTILYYLLAAIPSLKNSLHAYEIKHKVFYFILKAKFA